ncbi:hypothetical protein AVEN_101115-1, partial [Araneus ventricosus]
MSWQYLFLLRNQRPMWRFLPKAGSFIRVKDLLGDTPSKKCSGLDRTSSSPDLSRGHATKSE